MRKALKTLEKPAFSRLFALAQREGYSPKVKIYRFATGERAPRWLTLKCEPCDIRRMVRIHFLCAKKKAEGGVFTYGEDTHTLRLTSELVDLRVGYAAYGYTDAVSSVMCRVRPTHSCTLAPYGAVFETDRL